jgi:hypothetical protein
MTPFTVDSRLPPESQRGACGCHQVHGGIERRLEKHRNRWGVDAVEFIWQGCGHRLTDLGL